MSDKAKQKARILEKRAAILQWLSGEVYSTNAILGDLIGVGRNATYKTLVAMENNELVKRETVVTLGGAITIWGITPHGALMSL